MEDFIIMTDTTADLPRNYIHENQIALIFLPYTIDGVTYELGRELSEDVFYSKMRAGMMPSTSQVNPAEAKAGFEQCLKTTKQILYLAFSSGLSGTYNSAVIGAAEVIEENPDCRIIVIDTKAASLGEGLLVHKAVTMKKNGKSMDEVADWVEAHKMNLIHMFTVDDLDHLYRGGRVSKTAAVLGSMINIKPILHVDEEGHLMPVGKVRGRKKSLHTLVDYMEEGMGSFRGENDTIFISHGDAVEDARIVADEIEKRLGIDNFLIHYVGPTIGAHSGPGTIALFFMGEKR